MQRIDSTIRAEAKKDHPVVDTVSLTWEERQKSRQKLRTVHGREIALTLPTGTRLYAGELLSTAEGWIEVCLAPEDSLFIQPRRLVGSGVRCLSDWQPTPAVGDCGEWTTKTSKVV